MSTTLNPSDDAAMDDSRDAMRGRVVTAIRELHANSGGLARVHRTHAALYAQARRVFGSWRAAVDAAGLDYRRERDENLRQGLLLRDQRRALWYALSRFLLEQPGADDAALEAARPELARRVRRSWGSVAGAIAWAEQGRGRSAFTRLLHGGNG